jgi:hypothetical protein
MQFLVGRLKVALSDYHRIKPIEHIVTTKLSLHNLSPVYTGPKANKHFGPYRDNEAESAHGLYESFCSEQPPEDADEFCRFHCGTFCTSGVQLIL